MGVTNPSKEDRWIPPISQMDEWTLPLRIKCVDCPSPELGSLPLEYHTLHRKLLLSVTNPASAPLR